LQPVEAHRPCTADDESSGPYRCASCLTTYIEQARLLEERKTDPRTLLDQFVKEGVIQAGALVRTCPGPCGHLAYRAEGPACAHMHCSSCGVDWCWVCRAVFSTSQECYGHMDASEDDEFHQGVWSLDGFAPVKPDPTDFIA